jgi:hypothetical protein
MMRFVGWVEPKAKPIASGTEDDGFRYAQPILRATGWWMRMRSGRERQASATSLAA